MMPEALAAGDQDLAADQVMAAAAEVEELSAGLVAIGRLVEPDAVAVQHLIGAKHKRFRVTAGHGLGLELG